MLRLIAAAVLALLSVFPMLQARREAGGLVSRDWCLVRYGDVTSPKSPLGDTWLERPSLVFGMSQTSDPIPAGEHALTVFDGCNAILGLSYRVSADRLVVNLSNGWGGTLRGCPEERDPEIAAFKSGLEGSERFAVQKKTLTIFYNGGNSALVFESPSIDEVDRILSRP